MRFRSLTIALAALCPILALEHAHRPGRSEAAPALATSVLSAPIEASWLGTVRSQLAEREYAASENGTGLQAPNRAHNLRTYFEPAGVRVHDRTADGSPVLLQLSLTGVGRGARFAGVEAGHEVVSDGNRVEIRRPGLVEWYLNSAAGLEQGFTFDTRPEGKGDLALELGVTGARATRPDGDIVFETAAGRRLRYGKLVVRDAAGTEIAARFDVPRSDRFRIVVDDAAATYPLAIDPILTETADAQLEAGPNLAGAHLGQAISGAGDVNGDGYSDVIVGADLYDNGEADEGAAFVFHGSAAGIAITPSARLESNHIGARFGIAVAGAGDMNADGYSEVIVGAIFWDDDVLDEGAAFVFPGSAAGVGDATPSTPTTVKYDSNQTGSLFGIAVAGAGDVNGDGVDDVIVGAQDFDYPETDEGAAFVFPGNPLGISGGSYTAAVLTIQSNQDYAYLGGSVAGAGYTNLDPYADVIVGAVGYDAGQLDEGAAFVVQGRSGAWILDPTSLDVARLESDQAGAWLAAVAGAGDVNGDGLSDVIVGARGYSNPESFEGTALVFHGSLFGMPNGNPSTAASRIESNQVGARLGVVVGGAGDVDGDGYADVIVGSYLYDGGAIDSGAAFLFKGGTLWVPNGGPMQAGSTLTTDQTGAGFGVSVAGAGDVNGDGYDDVAVGAYAYDAGGADSGSAFVYHGGAEPMRSSPGHAAAGIVSLQSNSHFGYSVAGAGDVNGDGYGDVIIGAPGYDHGESDEGAAFLFLGWIPPGEAMNESTADAMLESDELGANFGTSVSAAGDVNGDGYGDVLVGAPDSGYYGAVFVFPGSFLGIPNSTPSTPGVTRITGGEVLHLWPFEEVDVGHSVAPAGDVDGDGYADVVLGGAGGDRWWAFVVEGGSAGIPNSGPSGAGVAYVSGDNGSYNYERRAYAAGAGDVNGDGYGDVVVGPGGPDAAYLFLGSPSGIADGQGPATTIYLSSGGILPKSVAGAGDVNGDGYADFLIGLPEFSHQGVSLEGAAFLILGSAAPPPILNPVADAGAFLRGGLPNSLLGSAVAGVGDVNGDGLADFAVSARDAAFHVDGAFVYHGRTECPIPVTPCPGTPDDADARFYSDQFDVGSGGVAAAGDVNGDGYADVIVGAPFYDVVPFTTNSGAAAIYFGNGDGDGRLFQAKQLGGTTPSVHPGGGADATDEFSIHFVASHPAGSGRVRAHAQACPPGVPFGHASCTSALGPWASVDAHTGQIPIYAYLDSLVPNTLYRWRVRTERASPGSPSFVDPAYQVGPWRRVQGQLPWTAGDIRTIALTDCANGLDDDDDGRIDYGEDLGCASAADTSERMELVSLAAGGWLFPALGGSGVVGGVDADLDTLTGGTFLAEAYSLAPHLLPTDPGVPPFNFSVGTSPAQYWQLEFTGDLNGPITLFIHYDPTGLSPTQEGALVIQHWVDGAWEEPPPPQIRYEELDKIAVTVTRLSPFVLGSSAPACSNGIDDDGDGRTDHPTDTGCTGPIDPSERQSGKICDDGEDNDGDLLTDYPADPGCYDPSWYPENPACNNGVDDDGDDLVDLADPTCGVNAWQNYEVPPPSGCGLLGIEALIVSVAIRITRSATRRRSR